MCHRRRYFFANLSIHVSGIERWSAGQHLVKTGAQGINVVEVITAFAVELLRAHVKQSAAFAPIHRQHAHRVAQTASNAEVGDFQIAALIDHQIRGLEIAMNDSRSEEHTSELQSLTNL